LFYSVTGRFSIHVIEFGSLFFHFLDIKIASLFNTRFGTIVEQQLA
jgi:hypothetical protein